MQKPSFRMCCGEAVFVFGGCRGAYFSTWEAVVLGWCGAFCSFEYLAKNR